MLLLKRFPKPPEPLLAETKMNMKGIQDHRINIVCVLSVGFNDLTVDFDVHSKSLFGGKVCAENLTLILFNSHFCFLLNRLRTK